MTAAHLIPTINISNITQDFHCRYVGDTETGIKW